MPESTPAAAQTLYIIDGHAQIFRAYYAIRGGLSSPVTGEPTQAVFGFAGMLIKLFSTFQPHYVIVAIDMPGKTFRDLLFDQYKAQRAAPPSDLISQIPRILELTKLFGIPILGQEGAEADDIIATVVRRVCKDPLYGHLNLRVVSKDKDLEQLLCDRVTLFDIHTDTTIDAAWLQANKGITPAQVVDLLALTGDTVDNVPGVAGIGPKTAALLIQEFGSIEGIYANLDKIKGKRRENLEAGRETLPLSRQLVTLKDDLELDFSLERSKAGPIDAAGLERFFADLGMHRHMTDLNRLLGRTAGAVVVAAPPTASKIAAPAAATPTDEGGLFGTLWDTGAAGPPSAAATPDVTPTYYTAPQRFDYQTITTTQQLGELVETIKQQKILSVDTETIGLGHGAPLCGISIAWKEGAGVYIPVASPTTQTHLHLQSVLDALREPFENPDLPKTGHNLKYDALALRAAGIRLRGIAFDSMIASHLLGSPAHGLDHLARTMLGHDMIPITRLIGTGKNQTTMDRVPLEEITPYAAEDADMALRLYQKFAPQLRLMGMEELAGRVEMPLVEVLSEMEFAGVRVDPRELMRQKQELGQRAVELREEVQKKAGVEFNVDSSKQLADVLFKRLGLPVVKKNKTGPSTDIEVLEKLADLEDVDPAKTAVPRLIVEYRQLTKLLNTYLDNLRHSIDLKTNRIHASFHQAGAATGRLSSSGPNLQNIPIRTEVGRQIRKAFVADEGKQLIVADYSQIELRILAHLSGDTRLTEAFDKDLDIHTAVAAQVFHVDLDKVSREQRNSAKIINFGIIYGVSAAGLSRRIEGLDRAAAVKLISDYRARFSGIDMFLQRCVQQAMELGYVTTIMNRRRQIPEIRSTNGNTRTLGERRAINSVVQGSAADLIKLAMVNLHRRIVREKLPLDLLLQVHDELVLEAPTDRAAELGEVVKDEMEHAMKLSVPLRVDVGMAENWLDAK